MAQQSGAHNTLAADQVLFSVPKPGSLWLSRANPHFPHIIKKYECGIKCVLPHLVLQLTSTDFAC